jgi:hypothetical protein
MASAAQELIDDLDEKVAQLKEAVQALTQASGRVSQPAPPMPSDQAPSQEMSIEGS